MSSVVRLFTLEEARRALPLVERVVRDLLAAHGRWREAVRAFEHLEAGAITDAPAEASLDAATAEIQRIAAEVDVGLAELDSIGCVFKGFDGGLVDFYSMRDDQLVFLCWRLGEPSIGYWHPVDGGFAGRQPLDTHLLTGTVS